ncbi:MAG: hypothetical protein P4L53_14755 [Candidatus Obscuribacterales bacterium]|nr:hypothetical protein [Candidatus Obscuribacterales bacterium]
MHKKHPSRLYKPSSPRNAKGTAAISEFALVLYVLFFIILVPVVDLGCLLIAAATQYLATNDFVAKAASQPDYMNALNAMFAESQKFETLGMSKFMNMTPQGGYVGSGDDLYVVATNIGSGGVTKSSANNSLPPPINTATNFYELSVQSTYSFKPVLSLAGVPLLGQVPGLGQPVTFTFVANRPVEHPGGLTFNGTNSTQGSVAFLPRNSAQNGLPSSGSSTQWRTPNIYQQILQAGQTVISTNVVVVQANNSSWTPGNVTVTPSEKMWIDTQAVGMWSEGGVNVAATDANGLNTLEPYSTAPQVTFGALAGKIGSGTPFMLGNNQTNLAIPGSGELALINNDGPGQFANDTGAQVVRIIVTQ